MKPTKGSIAAIKGGTLGVLFLVTLVTPIMVGQASQVAAAPVIQPYHPRAVTRGDARKYSPPDFTVYRTVQARKKAFYDYMLPKIRAANDEVMLERRWLLQVAGRLVDGESLGANEISEIEQMEQRYVVDSTGRSIPRRVGALLLRVDVVPASLVMAQAAKESGWGTSRFATEGNNFFGIWCFYHGCGMTPLRRAAGRNHEVAMFASVADGVRYYIRTLNTHPAYREFWEIRSRARREQQQLPGDRLAQGLVRYSERGVDYVREIQSMIRYNQLYRFNRNHQEA